MDRRTGRILLAKTYDTGRTDAGNCTVPCDRTPHLQYSDDDGRTWSKPRDLSDEILPEQWNSWYAAGPGHGIQLTRGTHAGRLVFGVNTETWNGSRVSANHAALVVSDDGGDSWRVGATDTWPIGPDGVFRQKPSEVALTERADGPCSSAAGSRTAPTWGTAPRPSAGTAATASPRRSATSRTHPAGPGRDPAPRRPDAAVRPGRPRPRRTMMVRSSYDGGRTWESVDRGTVVTTDWSGYSDMAAVDGGTVGLLYEGGAVDARDGIRFARFTEDWLKPRRGPDPTTRDAATGAKPAAVLGGAGRTAGVHGGALSFDGTDDAVRLPYRSRLPLGEGDFTASLHFRYTATTGEQPFLWMGGIGTIQPQIWLRGEPASNRVRGLITTRSGATTVRSASASTDGAHYDGR
ncbi:exo-alpha-sialidase [Streptomyces luteogriseus]|uniref:exo-alpha-sialidase n=1 Tax=Streptomyces luteogriseus TaxID=68233 RepID=UPI0037BD05A2